MKVYALSHIHDENTESEDIKFLGIFSNRKMCEKIIKSKYMKLPGFCDYGKECFKIEEFVIDEKITPEMELNQIIHSDVLFGYSYSLESGFLYENIVGISVYINNYGMGVYRCYTVDAQKKEEKFFKISPESMKKINDIIDSNQQYLHDEEIDVLPRSIHDIVFMIDSAYSVFTLKNREIRVSDIHYTDMDEFEKNKVTNLKFYTDFNSQVRQANKMLDVFGEIGKVLEREKIKLGLHKVEFLHE